MDFLNHPGSVAEQLADMLLARRAPQSQLHRVPLTDDEVSQVRSLRAQGVKRADIAATMGISVHTVIAILAGRRRNTTGVAPTGVRRRT